VRHGRSARHVCGRHSSRQEGTAETNITASISTPTNGFFLAGGQQQTQTIGALAAGATAGVYWFIGYGCTVNATTSPS
jgi:hypothetical protein